MEKLSLFSLIGSNINKILLVATGALLSPTTTWQGESIPCIAHAVAIERTIGVGV